MSASPSNERRNDRGHGSLRAQDRAAREAARTVFDRPVVLEAGAGTGKTTALVARVVAWLLEPGFERARSELAATARDDETALASRALERVLAITFTDAAAAEMDARIRAALAALESGADPQGLEDHGWEIARDERKRRAGALRRALDRPIAQTIHAWCQRLLAEHPLEAGLHPLFQVDAKARSVKERAREVVERALALALSGSPDPRWILLANRGIGPVDVETALVHLAVEGARAEDFARDPFPADVLAAIEARLVAALASFLDGCAAPLRAAAKRTPMAGKILDELSATKATFDRPPARTKAEASRRCRAAATIESKHMKRLGEWARGEFGTNETRDMGADTVRVQALARVLHAELARYRRLDPELTDAARGILSELLADLRARLVARGVETFGDLLRDARALLVNDAALCRRLRSRLDQVLVDEFQDTDPIQCDLVRALALDARHGPRIGLFLVGDPKQSIYGFRRADLAVYDAFVHEVLQSGGELYRLSVNFRSTQKILDEVEQVVGAVMVAERGLQPAFQPLSAARDDDGQPVEAWVAWDLDATKPKSHGKTDAASAARIEGRMLARALWRSRESGVEWREMAVLVRTNGVLDVLLEEMRELGVPYDVAGDKSYYRRREIVDATSLFTCVVDPNDRLALFALLRSPLVGAPDALLFRLWHTAFPDQMAALAAPDSVASTGIERTISRALADLPDDVPGLARVAGFERALFHAVECLASLRQSFAHDPSDVFVERLRTMFLVEATAASRYLGSYRLANLERFFGDVQAELDESGGDARSLLRLLRAAVDAAPDETEAKPRDAAESAVSVMTIHKSKGLDFKEVFVVGLHRGARNHGPSRGVRFSSDSGEYELFGAPTPGWAEVEERTKAREAAERVRLLYVAMTRAKDRLVLSGAWDDPHKAKPVAACTRLVELVAPRLPEEVLQAARAFTPGSASTLGIGGLLGVLPPALMDVPWRTSRPLKSPLDAPDDPHALEREAATLRASRAMAAQRAARPLQGAAGERRSRADELDIEPAERAQTPRVARGARPAALAGTAVHRLLEDFALAGGARLEASDRRVELERHVDAAVRAAGGDADSDRQAALAIAQSVLDAFQAGPLAQHLARIQPHVVARELQILLAPSAQDEPLQVLSGAIDLVYRDPESRELVVVDYKTDAIASDSDLRDHVARHRLQIDVYRRALREALELEALPRGELWFLSAARIERIE